MRPQVTLHADTAPDTLRTWGRTLVGQSRVLVPCVLMYLDGLDRLRQERVSVRYAESHNLVVAAVAYDPDAALAVVREGLAAAVLVAVEMSPAGLLDEVLGPVKVYYARRPVARVNPAAVEEQLVLRAIANSGGDVGLVSELLGVPLRDVQRLAADGRHTRQMSAKRPPTTGHMTGHEPGSGGESAGSTSPVHWKGH